MTSLLDLINPNQDPYDDTQNPGGPPQGDPNAPPQDPSQDNHIMQPLSDAMGQAYAGPDASGGATGPTSGGKPDWKKVLAAVGAGLGLGFLGSKASGGTMSFGQAVGHVGAGYAQDRYKVMNTQRDMARKQYDQQIDMIHSALQSMQGVDMSKYPRLKELSDKYRESLLSGSKDGHPISPKDATELLGLWTTAQGDISAAKGAAENNTIKRQAIAKQQAEIEARQQLYMQAMPGGNGQGMTPEQARMKAISDLTSNAMENEQIPINDPELGKFLGGAKTARRADIRDASAKIAENKAAMARIQEQENAASGRQKTELEATRQRMATEVYNNALKMAQTYNAFGQSHMTPQQAQAYAKQVRDEAMAGISGVTMNTPPPDGSTPVPGASRITVLKAPGKK